MKTVGQILAETRRQKNFSLEEVEEATKIRKKILQALENSDWAALPSPTFVKGLIRNYGRFLGLDQTELLAFYRREFDEKKISRRIIAPSQLNVGGFRLTPQLATVGAIGLIVLAVVVYLLIQFQSFTGPPLLEITNPDNNVKLTSQEVNLVGRTWEDAVLKVNGQPVQISPGGTFSVSVGLNPGINTLVITSANRFGKITTQTRTIIVDLSGQNQTAAPVGGVSLTIKITNESTNLSVEVDGQKQFDGLLVVGSEKTFHAKDKIKIDTKNAGSTHVIYSGLEQVLGNSGQEVVKTYP